MDENVEDEYIIVSNPYKKWKRLGLLLQSEKKDESNIDIDIHIDIDIDKHARWLLGKGCHCWDIFIGNI